MLHRTKYNRFRNESVTSVDELLHGLSMNPKVSATPQSAAETSYTPPTEVQSSSTAASSTPPTSHGSDHLEDGGTTLCTLINKVSNLKFSNSGSLLGIKGLPSAVKDLAVSKLQGGGGSGSGGSGPAVATMAAAAASGVGGTLCSSASHSTPCSQLEPAVSMSKKSRLDELQPGGGDDWNPGGGSGLVSKPSRGWVHSSEKISGPGVTYIVKVGGFFSFFCVHSLFFFQLSLLHCIYVQNFNRYLLNVEKSEVCNVGFSMKSQMECFVYVLSWNDMKCHFINMETDITILSFYTYIHYSSIFRLYLLLN